MSSKSRAQELAGAAQAAVPSRPSRLSKRTRILIAVGCCIASAGLWAGSLALLRLL